MNGWYGQRNQMEESEVGQAVRREGDMAGRDDGNDMVFGGSDRPFRRESTMVFGGGLLEDEGDRKKSSW